MRLQKYLAQSAVSSRRRAEQLIAAGAVKVNGQVVTAAGVMVKDRDRVEVDGKRVLRVDPVYRVLLKPRECLATFGDRGDRPTLRRYLHNPEPGLGVVAPLDYPAEGVVLLTTDGELAAAIAKRGQKVVMTYHIKFQGPVGDTEVARLARGWKWDDVTVRPAAVTALATTGKNTWVEIVVAEARPKALKAAGDIIRHAVLKISRVRLGSISFEGLAMGGWRDLSKGELADLRVQAGLSKAGPANAIAPHGGPPPHSPPRGAPMRARAGVVAAAAGGHPAGGRKGFPGSVRQGPPAPAAATRGGPRGSGPRGGGGRPSGGPTRAGASRNGRAER